MNAKRELMNLLDRIGTRIRQLFLLMGWSVSWLVLALVGFGIALAMSQTGLLTTQGKTIALVLSILALGLGLVCWVVSFWVGRDRLGLARRIEARHPDLGALLLTAVETEPPSHRPVGYLEMQIWERALAHGRTHAWDAIVSPRSLWWWRFAHLGSLALLIGVVAMLSWPGSTAAQGPEPVSLKTGQPIICQVEPGNAEVEKGSSLVITASFPERIPGEATLVLEGKEHRKISMMRSLDDPLFSSILGSVQDPMRYRVEYAGGVTPTYQIEVFEYPEIVKLDARLTFPSYTRLEPKSVADARTITVVEGTTVQLRAQLNKSVSLAKFQDNQGQEWLLSVDPSESLVRMGTLEATESRRLRAVLTDEKGRTNRKETPLQIHVVKNQPPRIKVLWPGRDIRVSPLEEIRLRAEIQDDFAVIRHGLTLTKPSGEEEDLVLGESVPGLKKIEATHLLDMERLRAVPDQVVSYSFWAEDLGPDGKPRRFQGDLFFAEVRPFEEIFRQGEQNPGERQNQNSQENPSGQDRSAQADQLAETQKQIVNGIWNLLRRDPEAKKAPRFLEDQTVLKTSQETVLEKAREMMGTLQGESVQHMEQALTHMEQAAKTLEESAKGTGSSDRLSQARSQAQNAYQALLKLRAREFDIQRSNSRQNSRSSSSSRSPSQRQLQQMDLTEQENRYETQSQARSQQERQAQKDQERQELRELEERLKDLARRQTDLNERIKELSAALESAKDREQKEELQKQLKRLRDQQRQILEDTDQLNERMDQSQNRERLANTREQVEQARENVQKAAESLDKGQLNNAATEGARAGRQLEQLKEELRQQSGNRFGEEMKEMRQQARDLDQNQKDITRRLEELNGSPPQGLRDNPEKKEMEKKLENQATQVNQLKERIKKTVEEAETTEPLLAQNLYQAANTLREKKLEENLDLARQLVRVGARP